MKNRILTGWTLSRVMFLLLGILIMVQAVLERQFIAIPFGAYFAVMGVFALGCAGGNCYGTNCSTPSKNKQETKEDEPIFEEIK